MRKINKISNRNHFRVYETLTVAIPDPEGAFFLDELQDETLLPKTVFNNTDVDFTSFSCRNGHFQIDALTKDIISFLSLNPNIMKINLIKLKDYKNDQFSSISYFPKTKVSIKQFTLHFIFYPPLPPRRREQREERRITIKSVEPVDLNNSQSEKNLLVQKNTVLQNRVYKLEMKLYELHEKFSVVSKKYENSKLEYHKLKTTLNEIQKKKTPNPSATVQRSYQHSDDSLDRHKSSDKLDLETLEEIVIRLMNNQSKRTKLNEPNNTNDQDK